ncbi:hypothetical protein VOLCADRAFT_106103 [Volvox carteri f. nagariensis]|uniref:Uncharacterized protein n=1 Tax=Volvox carteri f. nagariensis TaxID=3068 RepID=D8U530_VOLCA|nr:uncharacterized protein VOLCADRAFT_106103 [Volvox carteri f. nagariensis]EFJ45075.1 hypothetical protein VOLCADRAFT_106103 [Volvox carteri f. nagariensis]|eukprot:XP_002953751.1 hypothetical protein VOLCADRAFT_106103 [Volvox carteri f. nagariensis]
MAMRALKMSALPQLPTATRILPPAASVKTLLMLVVLVMLTGHNSAHPFNIVIADAWAPAAHGSHSRHDGSISRNDETPHTSPGRSLHYDAGSRITTAYSTTAGDSTRSAVVLQAFIPRTPERWQRRAAAGGLPLPPPAVPAAPAADTARSSSSRVETQRRDHRKPPLPSLKGASRSSVARDPQHSGSIDSADQRGREAQAQSVMRPQQTSDGSGKKHELSKAVRRLEACNHSHSRSTTGRASASTRGSDLSATVVIKEEDEMGSNGMAEDGGESKQVLLGTSCGNVGPEEELAVTRNGGARRSSPHHRQRGRQLQQVYLGPRILSINSITMYAGAPSGQASVSLARDRKFRLTKDGTVNLGAGFSTAQALALNPSQNRWRAAITGEGGQGRPSAATAAWVVVPKFFQCCSLFPSRAYFLSEANTGTSGTQAAGGYYFVTEIGANALSGTVGASTSQSQASALNLPSTKPAVSRAIVTRGDEPLGFAGVEALGQTNALVNFADPRVEQYGQVIAYPYNIFTPWDPVTCTQVLVTGLATTGINLLKKDAKGGKGGKEGKEGKGGKDGKGGKEGKDGKDGKGGKEGKEGKGGKDGKEGKEGKGDKGGKEGKDGNGNGNGGNGDSANHTTIALPSERSERLRACDGVVRILHLLVHLTALAWAKVGQGGPRWAKVGQGGPRWAKTLDEYQAFLKRAGPAYRSDYMDNGYGYSDYYDGTHGPDGEGDVNDGGVDGDGMAPSSSRAPERPRGRIPGGGSQEQQPTVQQPVTSDSKAKATSGDEGDDGSPVRVQQQQQNQQRNHQRPPSSTYQPITQQPAQRPLPQSDAAQSLSPGPAAAAGAEEGGGQREEPAPVYPIFVGSEQFRDATAGAAAEDDGATQGGRLQPAGGILPRGRLQQLLGPGGAGPDDLWPPSLMLLGRGGAKLLPGAKVLTDPDVAAAARHITNTSAQHSVLAAQLLSQAAALRVEAVLRVIVRLVNAGSPLNAFMMNASKAWYDGAAQLSNAGVDVAIRRLEAKLPPGVAVELRRQADDMAEQLGAAIGAAQQQQSIEHQQRWGSAGAAGGR